MKNPFNQLRMPGDMFARVDESTVRQVPIFTDSKETVYVLTGRCGDRWAAGYGLIYANGEYATLRPSAEYGLFATEDDARRFMVAAIAERSRVSDTTRAALERMVVASLQTTLF